MSAILEDLVEIVIENTTHITAGMTPEAAADVVATLVVKTVYQMDHAGATGDACMSDICRRLAAQLRALPAE